MHVNVSRMIELLTGALEGAEAAEAEAHLGSCEACRSTRERVRRMVHALEKDHLLEPSAAADAVVFGAMADKPAPVALPDWARGLKERVAQLVFDTFAQPDLAFAGARRSAAASRRLRFEAGPMELDVLLESDGDSRHVTAQLLSHETEALPISDAAYFVSTGGHLAYTGETNEFGELASEIQEPGDIEIRVAAQNCLAVFRIPDRSDASPGS